MFPRTVVFTAPPCQTSGHNVLSLSVRPSVRSFVCYQTCEHDISKMNKPILMPTGKSDPREKGVRQWASGGQSSRSNEAEDKLGGLAEASFWTNWVKNVGFLNNLVARST